MKLSQALKSKNRIIGEINRLKAIFVRENSRRSDNLSKVVVEDVFINILKQTQELVELKAKIAIANVPIYPKIEKISELKAWMKFIQEIPDREGTEVERAYGSAQADTYTWIAFMNKEAIDKEVQNTQFAINQLQDELDLFNAVTNI